MKPSEEVKPLTGPSDAAAEGMQPPSEVPSKRKAEEDPEDESDDDDDDEPDYEDEPDRYPVSHEIMLKDHTKVSHPAVARFYHSPMAAGNDLYRRRWRRRSYRDRLA